MFAALRRIFSCFKESHLPWQDIGEAVFLLNDASEIEGINEAATKLLGYENKDLKGSLFASLSAIENDPFFQKAGFDRVRRLGCINDTEKEMWTKEGALMPLSLSISHRKAGGFVCIAFDVRARRILQEELLKSFEQKSIVHSVHKLKDNFFSNMSHELRTPLNTIIGYSEMLDEELTELKAEEGIISDIRSIRTAGSDLLGLINRVLDLSRLDYSSVDVELCQIDLCELLDELSVEAQALAEKHRHTFICNASEQLGTIESDPQKLKEVLRQLLNNACKFTEAGGKIELDCQRLDDQLILTISDTGIGMLPEELEGIFQDFKQANPEKNRDFGGVGIGLSIVRRYVKLLKASINLSSQKGVGTKVELLLPISFKERILDYGVK